MAKKSKTAWKPESTPEPAAAPDPDPGILERFSSRDRKERRAIRAARAIARRARQAARRGVAEESHAESARPRDE